MFSGSIRNYNEIKNILCSFYCYAFNEPNLTSSLHMCSVGVLVYTINLLKLRNGLFCKWSFRSHDHFESAKT